MRQKSWPAGYGGRVLRNAFLEQWHGKESDLLDDLDQHRLAFETAVEQEDYAVANVIVGEAVGLIRHVDTAASIVADMAATATAILGDGSPRRSVISARHAVQNTK